MGEKQGHAKQPCTTAYTQNLKGSQSARKEINRRVQTGKQKRQENKKYKKQTINLEATN